MYYSFILYSPSLDQTFTGHTTRDKKIEIHELSSAGHSKKPNDLVIVWCGTFKNLKSAMLFERYLIMHSGGKFLKKELLEALTEITDHSETASRRVS